MAEQAQSGKPVLGWREWVVLPQLSPIAVNAKIDTGARTSALHAFDLILREEENQTWAEFEIGPVQRSNEHRARVVKPVTSFRTIRSSTGHSQLRPVIRTTIVIGGRRYAIDVTLASRDLMGFRLLLGRTAVRRRFWIDPGRSYLGSPKVPPAKKEATQ